MYDLNDVYFDLESADLKLDKVFSVIKFAKAGYENIEDFTSLDYYSMILAIENSLNTLDNSLKKIKEKLEDDSL